MMEALVGLLPFLVIVGLIGIATVIYTKRYYTRYEGYLDRVQAINEEILASNRALSGTIERNTAAVERLIETLERKA